MARHVDYSVQNTQASRIIAKFGTAQALADALAQVGCPRSVSSVCRWTYPKGRYKGTTSCTGGYIPLAVWPYILKAARLHGIIFTDKELRP